MATDVLLVSTNDISREGLSHILTSEGFNIVDSSERVGGLSGDSVEDDFLSIIDCPATEDQPKTVEEFKSRFPASNVVVLSEQFDMKAMIECFHCGAQGYIIKSMKSARLIAALRLVALGEKVVPFDIINVLEGQDHDHSMTSDIEHDIDEAHLSPRELDVLCCLMAGYPNKIIARQLDVCEATVKVHVKAILRKLSVNNRTQAAIWASSRGIALSHLDS